ncbi:hypothetical protein [Streptomyces sp. NPDC017941]|uniref:hypothetical protein n=1 Tax=Streptomyces sp. NPDC017941 TaxID=3365018 RepID=UPI0037881EE6
MSLDRVVRGSTAAAVTCTAAVAARLLAPSTAAAGPAAPALPPAEAGFDHRVGGAYTPPSGVKVVNGDHGAAPTPGLYDLCCVHAFLSIVRRDVGVPPVGSSEYLRRTC